MKLQLAAVILFALTLYACDMDAHWSEAEASICATTEVDNASDRSLVIQYKIENKGKVSINAASVSFMANTLVGESQQTYYWTDIKNVRIIPGGIVYLSCEQRYFKALETLSPNGVTIVSQFYE